MKWTVFVVLLLAASTVTAADDVREHGRATVEYSGKSLYIVATYDYAQTNHDGEWIAFKIGVTTERSQWLRPRDLELHTPDGRVIEAPTQSEARRAKGLLPEIQAAGAFGTEALDRLFDCVPVRELSTGGVSQYQANGGGCEDVWLWRLYGGTTTGHVAINGHRMARMFVFFQSSEGWPAGEYTFVLNGKDDTARLPVRLH